MLQNVADENVAPRKLDRIEDLVEELTGGTHERSSGLVFHRAWRFSDADKLRLGVPFTRNRILGRAMKRTSGARRYRTGDVAEREVLALGDAE